MAIETCIVAISGFEIIDNFEWLPSSFWSERLNAFVYTHKSPEFKTNNGLPSYNFDLLIEGTTSTFTPSQWPYLLPDIAYVGLIRENKITQLLKLNKLYQQYKPFKARELLLHYNNNSESSINTTVLGNGRLGHIVIKPHQGAEGIGQLLVNYNKVSPVMFHYEIKEAPNMQELLNKYPGDVQLLGNHSEHDMNNGLTHLKAGYFGMEYIPNVAKEYRLITDASCKVAYIQERVLVGDSFKQATGSIASIGGLSGIKILDNVADIPELNNGQNIVAFESICKAIGPMRSIDLYTTTEGEWGIFEYCNQFGTSGIPADVAQRLHITFVEDMLLRQQKELLCLKDRQ